MNRMTTLLAETSAYTDQDAYISDMALSSIWGDDPEDEIPAERIELLRRVWDFAHMDFSALRKASGLTQAAMADRFGIPLRTIENWDSGVRTPPGYVLRMMAEILKLTPKEETE